jgi:presenilin-like A22 family membrane protease
MKYSIPTLTAVVALFLTIQLVGLAVNNIYLSHELPYGLQPPEVNKEISPWYIVGVLITLTFAIILLKRIKMKILLKFWYFLAITTCVSVTLAAFLNPWVAAAIALVIVIIKMNEKDIYVHNLTEILTYGGVVALFAPMLDLWSGIVLLIIMSIYDYIAVFITKHMIRLAKAQQEEGIISGILVINKNEYAMLGGGDIAFTLLFAVVVLKRFGVINALFSIFGATLFVIILALIGQKKKYYPAMPFITAGSLLGLALSFL